MALPNLDNIDLSKLPEPTLQEQQQFAPVDVQPTPQDAPIIERVATTFQELSPTGNLVKYGASPFFHMEEGFSASSHPEYFKGIPEEDWGDIQDSESDAEATYRRNEYLTSSENLKKIVGSGGITGAALLMLPSILDLTVLAGGVGELKFMANIVSKGSRISRALKGGALLGATGTAAEGMVAAGSPIVDAEDMVYAGITSMVMGAGLAQLGKAKLSDLDKFAHSETQRVGKATLAEMDSNLVQGKKYGEVTSSADGTDMMGTRFADKAGEHADVMATEGATLQPSAINVGAKGTNIVKAIAEEASVHIPTDFAESALGKFFNRTGISDFARMYRSGDGARFWARHIFEDPSGAGGTRTKSVVMMKKIDESRLLDKAIPSFRPAYRQYAKDLGIHPLRDFKKYMGETRSKFDRDLTMEMNLRRQADFQGFEHASPHSPVIQKLADDLQVMADETLTMGQRAGVAGMENIKRVPGYLPLKWSGSKLLKLTGDLEARYTKLLSRAYQATEIDPKVADKIAKAVIRRSKLKDLGIDANPERLFAKDSRLMLEDIMKDGGIEPEELASIMAQIDRKAEQAGTSTHARRRTPFDITVSDGELSLMDIMDTDVQSNMTRYVSEMTGRAGLARKGIKSDADWQTLKEAVISTTPNEYLKGVNNTIDATYSQLLGRPVRDGVDRNARRMMDWGMTSALGMVGAAQTAEWANVLAAYGARDVYNHIPELRRARKALKAGRYYKAGVLGELKVHLGNIWDEQLIRRPEVRLDEHLADDGTWMRMFDNVQAAAVDKLGYISGMNQIKSMQQQFTVMLQTDKVFKFLKAGTKNDDAILRQFADMGWHEGTLAKLRKQIDNGNVTFQPNGSVDRLNMEKWGDELINDFAEGIHRHTNQIIHLPLIGENNWWMGTTMGSLLTQFRTFPLTATEKQLARKIKMGDTESYMSAMYGMGLSSAVVLAKAAAMDIGSDADKTRLDELLSPAGVVKGATRYAGAFGFAPDVIGAALNFTGASKAMGSSARGYGNVSIPAVDIPLKLVKGASGLFQTVTGQKDLTKSDISNSIGGMMYGNIYPTVITSNLLKRIADK